MAVVRLLVELPEGMTLASLRELLRMNGVRVRQCEAARRQPSASPQRPSSVHLTLTELSVLKAFTYCDTSREIAALLGISESTVRSHIKSLFHKLSVRSRANAVGRALRLGLLTTGDLTPPPNEGEKSPKRRIGKRRNRTI